MGQRDEFILLQVAHQDSDFRLYQAHPDGNKNITFTPTNARDQTAGNMETCFLEPKSSTTTSTETRLQSHPKTRSSSTQTSSFVSVSLTLCDFYLIFPKDRVLTTPGAASLSERLLATQYNALEHKRQNNAITP